MCFLSFGQSSANEVMLDVKKSTCMYEFGLYPVIMITKLQKLLIIVHDQQKR